MTKTLIYNDVQLEVDRDRGVIYIHHTKLGQTLLRICGLPTPLPPLVDRGMARFLDITHMYGVNWLGEVSQVIQRPEGKVKIPRTPRSPRCEGYPDTSTLVALTRSKTTAVRKATAECTHCKRRLVCYNVHASYEGAQPQWEYRNPHVYDPKRKYTRGPDWGSFANSDLRGLACGVVMKNGETCFLKETHQEFNIPHGAEPPEKYR